MIISNLTKKIDLERSITVPVFASLLFYGTLGTFQHITAMHLSLTPILFAIYRILSLCFITMVIVLFFKRKRATEKSKGFIPNFLAYAGTFLMLFAAFAKSETELAPIIISVFLMIAGMSFSIYSLKTLGKSFGIRPEARSLVRSGPYRFIRHPLYVGEFIAVLGGVLTGFSAAKAALFLLWICIQAYRAIQEEKVLEQGIPEYAAYKLETKRFIPGIF